jgi:flavin-binding protein dodecin
LSRRGTTEGGAAVNAQDEFDGQGPTLHDAANNAWDKAKNAGKDKGWFEIKKIEVRCENPIREYRVKIKG